MQPQQVAGRTTRINAFTESENHFQTLFEKSADAQFLLDGDVFMDCNAAALQMMRCTRKEELLGRHPDDFSPHTQPDGRLSWDKAKEMVANALDRGSRRFEWVHRRADGTDFPAEVALTAISVNGKSLLHAGVRDVTERERSQRALRESEQKYRDLAELLPQTVFEMDSAGKIIFMNNQGLQYFGYTREDFEKGVWLPQVVVPEDYPRALDDIRRVFEGEERVSAEYTAVRKDGSRFPCIMSATLIITQDKPFGIRGIVTDITAQKRTEETLRESEERYRTAIEHSNDGVAIMKGDEHVYVNQKFLSMFGYDAPEEILGKPTFTMVHPEDREKVSEMNRRRQRGEPVPSRYEIKGLRKDGRMIYIEVSATKVLYRGEARSLAYLRDVTERKQAEEVLRVTQFSVDHASEAVIWLDAEGRFIYANEAACEAFGYSQDELRSMRISDIDVDLTQEAWCTRWVEKKQRGAITFESRYRSRDGRMFPVEIKADYAKVGDREYSFVSIRDITERKQAEEQITASLREKEALLKEIHHRVKNNLQIVSSLLHLQARNIEHPGAIEVLRDSQSRVRSMALIHEKLYGSPNLASVDMAEYARDLALQVFKSYRDGGQSIRLRTNLDNISLDISRAIPCGLIINELVSNALKHAFPEGRGGEITLQLQRGNGGKMTLVVADSGIGLPEHVDFQESPSLGFNLVCTLVKQLDGTIELDRSAGTAFAITFG